VARIYSGESGGAFANHKARNNSARLTGFRVLGHWAGTVVFGRRIPTRKLIRHGVLKHSRTFGSKPALCASVELCGTQITLHEKSRHSIRCSLPNIDGFEFL
jgi:hypothetical protein